LEIEAGRTIGPDWKDPPASGDVPSDLADRFAAAGGVLTDRVGYCTGLPPAEALAAAERLRPLGFRPLTFRPYRAGGEVLVAGAWRRDGTDWRLAAGLAADALAGQNAAYLRDGFHVADVSAVPGPGGPVYAAVWTKAKPGAAPPELVVGMPVADKARAAEKLTERGFAPVTGTECDGGAGRVYTAVWAAGSQIHSERGTGQWLAGRAWGAAQVSDVRIDRFEAKVTGRERYEAALAKADADLKKDANDPAARFRRGQALYNLGRYDDAVPELLAVTDRDPNRFDAYGLRILAEARRGNTELAKRERVRYGLRLPDRNEAVEEYLAAVVAACAGNDGAALKQLAHLTTTRPKDATFLIYAARAFAVAAEVVAPKAKDRADGYARQAVELCRQALANGLAGADQQLDHRDFDSARDRPDFQALTAQSGRGVEYAVVWRAGPPDEELAWVSAPAAEHRARADRLLADGYRPRSLSAGWDGPDRPTLLASVWHRPYVKETDRDAVALRRANALLALAKLDPPPRVWPHLKAGDDDRLRTLLVHRFGPQVGDPFAAVRRLDGEPDPSARQALILCLGEFPADKLLPRDRGGVVERLARLYQDDPDPGVHAAAEWLLRKWGHADRVAAIDAKPAAGPPDRGWDRAPHGHTLAVVPGPVRFRMGSSGNEPGRGSDEAPEEKALPHGFAIATKEVTADQMERFRQSARKTALDKRTGPLDRLWQLAAGPPREKDPDAGKGDQPACPVTYLEAVAYCRWLSDEEKLPESQMCYPPLDQLVKGFKTDPGQPAKTGYRLPTAAEWEYACRAGTVTARHYGQAEDLLGKYAWYDSNSKVLTLPRRTADVRQVIRQWNEGKARLAAVGRLMPNRLGLFDTLGNAAEWCHDLDGVDVSGTVTPGDFQSLERAYRAVRGGSYRDGPEAVRSAARGQEHILFGGTRAVGFRIARTVPAVPKR
jgi:formylglycine-generating enzyme required for sulfatase activity/tetratricopeptide (TPR) repeat protein